MPVSKPAGRTADEHDRALLAEVLRDAAALALPLQKKGVRSWTKGDRTPVSDADLAVDRFLHDRLTAARPSYGWLSEESGVRAAKNGTRAFLVDPIDGTRAFLNGRDTWTITAAIVESGEAVAGGVANPGRDELYLAHRNGGATMNGQALAVSGQTQVPGSRLAGGEGAYASARTALATRPPPVYVGATSMAYRLCLVASGACDATIAFSGKADWDLAAGVLLVHEAGGVVSDRFGRPLTLSGELHESVVGANPTLHRALLALLNGRIRS